LDLPKVPFHNLASRHPGVTAAIGECYTQAARVCLDRHHLSPAEITLDGTSDGAITRATAEWTESSGAERGAWANDTDTTEQGAYGFALAIVDLTEGMVAVRRAETGTGADYYLAAPGAAADDLESCFRLEVSGVDKGDERTIRQRLMQKVQQTRVGVSNLPAFAAVVGFRELLIVLARAE
jgi:hypothetical protein